MFRTAPVRVSRKGRKELGVGLAAKGISVLSVTLCTYTIILQSINISVGKKFGSETKAFNDILLPFANSALSYKNYHGLLSHANTNVAIFPKTVKQIKFLN